MQQVIQHILLLTRNVEIAVELEMVHQVLINFDNLLQIERYIEEAYQLSGRVYLPYFQVQFISVIFDTDELAIIQSSQISYSRRMKRQQKLTKNLQQEKQGRQNKKNCRMAKMHASFKSSPRHEEVKKGDRIRKKAKAGKINFDEHSKVPRFEFKVSVFEELINSGSYYICCL